jgi:hypothetical protein
LAALTGLFIVCFVSIGAFALTGVAAVGVLYVAGVAAVQRTYEFLQGASALLMTVETSPVLLYGARGFIGATFVVVWVQYIDRICFTAVFNWLWAEARTTGFFRTIPSPKEVGLRLVAYAGVALIVCSVGVSIGTHGAFT